MTDPFKRLFGPSPNTQITERLSALAACAHTSVVHLAETKGDDLAKITEFEHQGDQIVRDIHALMDSAFILRFDKGDISNLTSHLDDIIDATRKVATHKHIYGEHLKQLRPEAAELIEILEKMTTELEPLVKQLASHPIGVEETRPHLLVLKDLERKADDIHTSAEQALVKEFGTHGNPIAYIGWDKLYRLLERASDRANYCGIAVNSMARKEA